MIIGYIGLAFLMLSYMLLVSKWSKYFLRVDIVASVLLTIHAVIIKDIPFIVVNSFIAIMLIYKQFNGGIK